MEWVGGIGREVGGSVGYRERLSPLASHVRKRAATALKESIPINDPTAQEKTYPAMNANDMGCREMPAHSTLSHSVIISMEAEIPPSQDRIFLESGANKLDVLQTIPHTTPRITPIVIVQRGAREAIMNEQPTVRKKTGSKRPNAMISH
jgi:hypothetical protein